MVAQLVIPEEERRIKDKKINGDRIDEEAAELRQFISNEVNGEEMPSYEGINYGNIVNQESAIRMYEGAMRASLKISDKNMNKMRRTTEGLVVIEQDKNVIWSCHKMNEDSDFYKMLSGLFHDSDVWYIYDNRDKGGVGRIPGNYLFDDLVDICKNTEMDNYTFLNTLPEHIVRTSGHVGQRSSEQMRFIPRKGRLHSMYCGIHMEGIYTHTNTSTYKMLVVSESSGVMYERMGFNNKWEQIEQVRIQDCTRILNFMYDPIKTEWEMGTEVAWSKHVAQLQRTKVITDRSGGFYVLEGGDNGGYVEIYDSLLPEIINSREPITMDVEGSRYITKFLKTIFNECDMEYTVIHEDQHNTKFLMFGSTKFPLSVAIINENKSDFEYDKFSVVRDSISKLAGDGIEYVDWEGDYVESDKLIPTDFIGTLAMVHRCGNEGVVLHDIYVDTQIADDYLIIDCEGAMVKNEKKENSFIVTHVADCKVEQEGMEDVMVINAYSISLDQRAQHELDNWPRTEYSRKQIREEFDGTWTEIWSHKGVVDISSALKEVREHADTSNLQFAAKGNYLEEKLINNVHLQGNFGVCSGARDRKKFLKTNVVELKHFGLEQYEEISNRYGTVRFPAFGWHHNPIHEVFTFKNRCRELRGYSPIQTVKLIIDKKQKYIYRRVGDVWIESRIMH